MYWRALELTLIATKEFSNFDLTMDFKLPENVIAVYLFDNSKKGTPTLMVLKSNYCDVEKMENLKPNQFTGSIYAALAPSHRATKKVECTKYSNKVCG